MALTETLAMVITAEGAQASAVLDDLGAKLTKLNAQADASGKAVSSALTVGAVVAGAVLIDMLDKGTKALIQQQATAAQTEAALTSTGDAANVTAKHVDDLATSVSNYSGKSLEAVTETENLLLTFTNIRNVGPNKIFDETTKAVFDMSQALGIDATAAAKQLGKALNEPDTGLTALQRAGVQFTTSQKDVIKSLFDTGHEAQAQQLILDQVAVKFGGSAKAYGDTTAGELQKEQNAVLALEKALATPLTSSPVRDTLDAIVNATDYLNQHPFTEDSLAVILGVGAAWKIAGAGIGLYRDIFSTVAGSSAAGSAAVAAEGDAVALTGTEANVAAGQMGLFAAAEDAAGASGAASVGGITAAGDAAVATGGKLATTLGLLRGFLGIPALAVGAGLVISDLSGGDNFGIGNANLAGKSPDQVAAFLKSAGLPYVGPSGQGSAALAKDQAAWASANPAVGGRGSALGRANAAGANANVGYGSDYNPLTYGRDFSQNAAGIYGSDLLDDGSGGVDYTAKGGQFYVAPKGSAGGSGSSALATAQAQATLAGLFGLTPDGIAAALDQGLVTGADPLSQLMQDAGSLLTGTAKSIVGNLSSILDAAIQAGQSAQKSLQFSVAGAPGLGNEYTAYTDPKTLQTKLTLQSPVLGQLQQQLGLDQRFAADYTKLSKAGLNQDILSQYGPSNIDGLDALANSSPADIAAINKADQQVNLLARSFGQQVAQSQYLASIDATLKALQASLPGAVTKTSLVQTNSTAAKAAIQARTVPSKGLYTRSSR